mgnify:CR=1 FL=1
MGARTALDTAVHLEHADHLGQGGGLVPQALGRSCTFFDQGRVLLGDLIQLRDRLAHLVDARGLLGARAGDFADELADALNLRDDLGHGSACIVNLARAHLDLLDAGTDQRLDLFGRFG